MGERGRGNRFPVKHVIGEYLHRPRLQEGERDAHDGHRAKQQPSPPVDRDIGKQTPIASDFPRGRQFAIVCFGHRRMQITPPWRMTNAWRAAGIAAARLSSRPARHYKAQKAGSAMTGNASNYGIPRIASI